MYTIKFLSDNFHCIPDSPSHVRSGCAILMRTLIRHEERRGPLITRNVLMLISCCAEIMYIHKLRPGKLHSFTTATSTISTQTGSATNFQQITEIPLAFINKWAIEMACSTQVVVQGMNQRPSCNN